MNVTLATPRNRLTGLFRGRETGVEQRRGWTCLGLRRMTNADLLPICLLPTTGGQPGQGFPQCVVTDTLKLAETDQPEET